MCDKLKSWILIACLVTIGFAAQAQNRKSEESISPPRISGPVSESIGNDPAGPSEGDIIQPAKVREEESYTEGADPVGPPEVPGNTQPPKASVKPADQKQEEPSKAPE